MQTRTKSQLRKIITVFLGIILCMLLFSVTNVYAKTYNSLHNMRADKGDAVNNKIYLTGSDLKKESNHLFCIQHFKDEGATYTIKDYIKIEGRLATNHNNKTWLNKKNAKLAYVIYGSSYGSGYMDYEPGQSALYNFFNSWAKSAHNAGILKAGWPQSTNKTVPLTAKAQKLLDKGQDYADSLDKSEIIENKTPNPKKKVIGEYIYIGPMKWDFQGTLKSVKVHNDTKGVNMSTANYDFCINKGGNYKVIKAKNIPSNSNFYLRVKISTGAAKITISGTQERPRYNAELWLLNSSYAQNLMATKFDDTPKENKFSYSYTLMGNLELTKVNGDNTSQKLAGVGFRIYNKDTKKYVVGNGGYTTDVKKATTFYTDKNGKLTVKNLLIGNYSITEVVQPNYGFVMNPNPVSVTIGNTSSTTVKKTISNYPIYIKVGGFVWLDQYDGKGANTGGNNYYDNPPDVLMPGITVNLYNPVLTGGAEKIIKTTKTDANGSYNFGEVKLLTNEDEENPDKRAQDRANVLKNYYVEFIYDGLKYTTVLPNTGATSVSSKAQEDSSSRKALNDQFAEITGTTNRDRLIGSARDVNGNVKRTLEYTDGEKESDGFAHKVTSEPKTYKPNTTIVDTNDTMASTKGINSNYFYSQYKPGTSEIKYINMGLKEREKPDIALTTDIDTVQITVNGYTNTYKYSRRITDENVHNGDGFNVGVKFSGTYDQQYTRAIYPSDIEYNPENANNELQVTVNYKTLISNESNNLKMKLTELVNYHDSREEIAQSTYTYNGQQGNITWNITGKYGQSYNKEMYKVDGKSVNYVGVYTKDVDGIVIEPKTQLEVNTTVKLSKSAIQECLSKDDGTGLLRSVMDVNSYSTLDASGNVYAGVDKDSAAGNATPIGNMDVTDVNNLPAEFATYEDDTDQAPVLKFELYGERTLNGVVFEDTTQEELQSGNVREGTGEYENGEPLIDNVTISMIDKEKQVAYYTTSTVSEMAEERYAVAILIKEGEPNYQDGWQSYNITFREATEREKEADFGSIKLDNTGTQDQDGVLINGKYMIADFVPPCLVNMKLHILGATK